MPRPVVPHCEACPLMMLKPRSAGGVLRYCCGGTGGPPIPIPRRELRHTSPDWCPQRYGTLLRLEWERVPNDVAPPGGVD